MLRWWHDFSMDVSPQPVERRYPDPVEGPYRLRLWVAVVQGRPGIVGVEMWGVEPHSATWHDWSIRASAKSPQDDIGAFEASNMPALLPTTITASAIRLPLGAFIDGWVTSNRALGRAALKIGADPARVSDYLAALKDSRRGRPPLPDEWLRIVATIYEAAIAEGDRAPARAVERDLKKRYKIDPKATTVRSWIKAARDRRALVDEISRRRRKP
jgi:hypothetical protein